MSLLYHQGAGPPRVISTDIRDRPAIYPTEFRTEYETHQEVIKDTLYETVHVPDPSNPGRTMEKLVPRDITHTVEKLVPKDWVTWVTKGSSTGNLASSCSDKIDRIRKADASGQPNPLWEVLEPAYNAWKVNQEPPVDGTPLDTWPGVTPQQVKIIRDFHLRTVEDFATAPDSALTKMGIPGIRQLQQRAQRFLDAAGFMREGGQHQFATELAQRDETIGSLKSELDEMRSLIEEITQSEEEGGTAGEEPRRKGGWPKGRPRKLVVPEPTVNTVTA